jgi:hypothetical protein
LKRADQLGDLFGDLEKVKQSLPRLSGGL